MTPPISGELYPVPVPSSAAARAWDELRGRVVAELPSVEHAVSSSRRGGDAVAGQVSGARSSARDVVDHVVHGPRGDQGAAAAASSNAAAASVEMGRAVGKAHDPATDPGEPNFDAAISQANGAVGQIHQGAGALRRHPEPGGGGDGGPQI